MRSAAAGRRPREEEGLLALVAGERGRALELDPALRRAGRRGTGNPPWPPAGARSCAGPRPASISSTSARPASGPKAMLWATARFSSTTGDGMTVAQRVVERRDPLPVRVLRRARPGVAGGERGLQRVGPVGAAQRLGACQGGEAAADQQLVPAGAVLLGQRERASRPAPCGRPDARPGFPSAPGDRRPPARRASGRRGCGPGAAPRRTGPGGSGPRRRWPHSPR